MPVLVISNFDDNSIKNEWASMETAFSHYQSMGKFFKRSRASNFVVSGLLWPKFEFIRDFMKYVCPRFLQVLKWSDQKQRCMDSQPALINQISYGFLATHRAFFEDRTVCVNVEADDLCVHWVYIIL